MANHKFHYEHAAHIKPAPRKNLLPSKTWSMLAAGLVFGFLGMYFTVTKPMSDRMHLLETEIASMQSDMQDLTGTRDDLWKTNDLLAGLRQQKRQLAEAEESLAAVRKLRNEVLALTAGQKEALKTVQQVASLQTDLKKQSQSLTESQDALASFVAMKENVERLGKSAAESRQSLVATREAFEDVQSTSSQLTERMNHQVNSLNSAGQVMESLEKLTADVVATKPQVEASHQVVSRTNELHKSLIEQEKVVPEAQKSLTRITQLEKQLANQDDAEMKQASANLNEILTFHRELATNKNRITSAIKTVELLEDFQDEIEHQASTLMTMRRDLQELSVLKSTVDDTMAVLKPLIELNDLRRLSNTEVRDAAQVILNRRIANGSSPKSSRVAEKEISSPIIKPSVKGPSKDLKVPVPTDLE